MKTKHKKILVYIAFALTLGLVCVFWLQGLNTLLDQGYSADKILIAFGRLTGLLAVYFVLLQLLITGRPLWLEKNFGLDKLLRFHHLNGLFLTFVLLAHPILLSFGYGMANQVSAFTQLSVFISDWEDVFVATVSLGLFLLVIFLSAYVHIRKAGGKSINYECWRRWHLLAYPAVILAFPHQYTVGGDFIQNPHFSAYWLLLFAFPFGNLLIFKILRPIFLLNKHRFYVQKIQPENYNVTSIYIAGRNMNEFKITGGQFIFLRFLTAPLWWQAHPFSVSACPDGNRIRVSIKNVGDFTSKIKNLKVGTKILINGPYGVFTEKSSSKNKVLLIAGGIGVAPVRPLAEQLAKLGKKVVLLYSNRTESDIVFKKEFDELSAKYGFPVWHILSQQQNYKGEKGRVDGQKIKRLVPDYMEREVFLCGPEPMIRSVTEELKRLGVSSQLIHFEKFSL